MCKEYLYIFLVAFGAILTRFVLLGENQRDLDGNLVETLYCRYERDACLYLKFYTKFFLRGKGNNEIVRE